MARPRKGYIIHHSKDRHLVRVPVVRDGKRGYINRIVRGTDEDAKRELRAMMHDEDTGALVQPTKQTLADWLREWLAQHIQPNREAKTFDNYTHAVEGRLVPTLGGIRLVDLTPRAIQKALMQWATDGLSGTTRREYFLILHNALATAVRMDVLRQNPADRVEAPTRDKRARRGLDTTQFFALVNAAEALDAATATHKRPARYAFAVRWLGLSGMRPGEARRLRVRDLDLKTGQAHVRKSKTDAGIRDVDLLPTLILAAQHHLDERDAKPDDLLLVHADGKPIDLHNFGQRVLPDLLKAAGLPDDVRVYDLRHTYNVVSREAGVPLDVVQVNMGHAKISTTADVYGRVPVAQRQAGLKRLAAHLNRNGHTGQAAVTH